MTRGLALVFAATASLAVQQTPPRDALPPGSAATGIIRGRVIAGDTGAPMPYAMVSAYKEAPGPWQGMVMTDRSGRFEFVSVPAGAVYLYAQSPLYRRRYQGATYPRTDSTNLREPIALAQNQTLDKVEIVLPPYSAISGRILDDDGFPLTGVQVSALRVDPAGFEPHSAASMSTDDRGVFRVYGLADGEYLIRASLDVSVFLQASATWISGDSRPAGFATTFYPGTLSVSDAARIRIRNAREVADLEMRLIRTPVFRVSGVIMDSQGRPLSNNHGARFQHTLDSGGSSQDLLLDTHGGFTIRDLVPGDYAIRVQPNQPIGATGAPPREFAYFPVTVTGADVTDVLVTTRPGVDVTGRVVFEQGTPAASRDLWVRPRLVGRGLELFLPVRVESDLSFTLHELSQTALIRLGGGVPDWWLKAVMLSSEDITDRPMDFKATDSGRLQIVLSSRMAAIDGAVSDARGESVPGAQVVLFSADPSAWVVGSTRTRITSVDRTSRFRIPGVRDGRYLIVATTRSVGTALYWNPRAVLESLTKSATELFIRDDEHRTIDLRLVPDRLDRL